MADTTDNLIEALVRARENGMSRYECAALVRDVFRAPWSDTRPVNSISLRYERLNTKRGRPAKGSAKWGGPPATDYFLRARG